MDLLARVQPLLERGRPALFQFADVRAHEPAAAVGDDELPAAGGSDAQRGALVPRGDLSTSSGRAVETTTREGPSWNSSSSGRSAAVELHPRADLHAEGALGQGTRPGLRR